MTAPSAAADAPTLRALFGQRAYLLMWAARLMGNLATAIQSIAIAWQVYAVARLTGTVAEGAFAVGMIGLAQFLPMFCLALIAGQVADRHDRRLIMAGCMVVELISAGALCALAYTRFPAVWPIYLIAVAFGGARAFYQPAGSALGPTLVPRYLLPRAIALNSLSWQMAAVVGPAIGGILVAGSASLAFGAAGVLFGLSIALLCCFASPPQTWKEGASRLEQIREGLHYLWTNRFVLGAISLDLFAVLLGGATALLPVYARDVLHAGSEGFGILRAAPAIGGVTMAAVLGAVPIRRHAGIKMFLAVAGFGLATVVFAVSKSVALSVVALALLGASDMISVFVRQSLVQIMTPNEMRGRVAAVSTLFIGASNELGEFESGVAARFLGPVGACLFGGVGSLAVTGLWAWLFPALRRADRLE
ncbi:MAG TPA: MFS transporter [Caulobacteraceae bacterium]|jgi:MFS family permease